MPYLDGTEQHAPQTCPLCKRPLVTRWVGQRAFKTGAGHVARAAPLFVCVGCRVSVRLSSLPDRPLRTTRARARSDAE